MPLLIAVMGPTASGKTPLAEFISERLDAQLINADAFQVYRGLDIGTAKPPKSKTYELLDLKNPDEEFGVGEWVLRAVDLLRTLHASERNAVIVGGTGFYIRALMEQYSGMQDSPDPELRARLNESAHDQKRAQLERDYPEVASRVDLKNPVRVQRALERQLSAAKKVDVELPPFTQVKLGLMPGPDELNDRIERRVLEMLQNGWTQEIENLREKGYRKEHPAFRAIGYRPLWGALEGTTGLDEAVATTIAETRRYAKRQRTWLRSEPRLLPVSVHPGGDPFAEALERIAAVLK